MKKALVSSVTALLSLSVVAPAFAYITPLDFIRLPARIAEETARTAVYDRPTRRDIRENNQSNINDRNRNILQEMKDNKRANQTVSPDIKSHLMRMRMNRQFRRLNRTPKAGSDRYRILHRPNTRHFRIMNEQSALPSLLVTTGGGSFDRPTRRDITGNANIVAGNRRVDLLQKISVASQ